MTIKKSYNTWAASYDNCENKTRDLEKIVIRKTLANQNFKRVIEIGCGTGKNTEWLLGISNSLTGLDFSEKMLEKAKEKIKSPKVTFRQSDINQKWPVEEDAANLISCSLTLEHISDLNFIFGQAAKSLQENGKFYICELHPFKQYIGSKAKFETDNGVEELQVYVHHVSEYLNAASGNIYNLI